MSQKLIVRIANGLGNQLFLYASAFAISKKINKILEIDNESGFLKEDRKIRYELDNFKITSNITEQHYKFNNKYKNIKRKVDKKLDFLRNKKKFLIEDKKKNSFIKFSNKYFCNRYQDIVYMEGYFQSEKYFKDYETDIKSEFNFNQNIIDKNEAFKNDILNSNSVLIHIRNHVFSETIKKQNKILNLEKSNIYTQKTILHCKKAIEFFKKKISNPMFFIFSNDFNLIKKSFIGNEFKYMDKNESLMPIDDFYLMTLCKHFIISPSTFSWWAAWLSKNKNKICVKPDKDLFMSSNLDIYPNNWINI